MVKFINLYSALISSRLNVKCNREVPVEERIVYSAHELAFEHQMTGKRKHLYLYCINKRIEQAILKPKQKFLMTEKVNIILAIRPISRKHIKNCKDTLES